MKISQKLDNFDFGSIPIDPFWNTGNRKENKMHKIHAYPAKFPAFITTKAIEYAEEFNPEIKLVADMFCGCGTVAYEASRNGKDFWGCDINPVATLIAVTKSRSYLNKKLDEYYIKIVQKYNNTKVTSKEIESINHRINYWYKEKQIHDLLRLKKSIYDIVPSRSKYLKFFLTAFSNILKPTSVWLTKSIKPQVDPNKKPMNVINAFAKQYNTMYHANEENEIQHQSDVKIDTINFLLNNKKKPFVDLIVSSPPYVTSYEYADLHQLSTLWLDFVDDYRSLRDGTIGSLYNNSNLTDDIKLLNKTGENIFFKLYNKDKRKAKSTAKYFVDMQKSIEKAYGLLNDNGVALFIIGNTEYKSVKINNAKHLIECMLDVGFKNIEIIKRKISNKILTPYRDDKGKFTTDKNSRKVYAEEFIIIGKKFKNEENIKN